MPRSTKVQVPTTPQAKLNAVIKSARDAMRKDAGLNGDLDRIPQLAWLRMDGCGRPRTPGRRGAAPR